ncbi:hypothetical protein AB0J83_43880 [Actinoplanes sp. NPDC049596]|uniref:hypothetical protein n=1 Tax=unclassified Actinoplanes TaxID=2626549 RepID=UPI00344111BD
MEHLLTLARARGTGADRQRAVWNGAGSPADVVAALAATTRTDRSPASGESQRSEVEMDGARR